MNREMPFSDETEQTNISEENNENTAIKEQKPKELTEQEKTDLALKKTFKEIKESVRSIFKK